jgi:hypothetical protein
VSDHDIEHSSRIDTDGGEPPPPGAAGAAAARCRGGVENRCPRWCVIGLDHPHVIVERHANGVVVAARKFSSLVRRDVQRTAYIRCVTT